MFKNVWAVVLGVIAAMLVMMAGEPMIGMIYKIPPDLNYNDKLAVAGMINNMPPLAFAFLLLVHSIASFAGGIVATLLSRRSTVRPALVTGILLVAAAIVNFIRIPHPFGFVMLNLVIYIPIVYLGYRVVRKK
jgi:hypothetical protein